MQHEVLSLTAILFQSSDIAVVTGSRLFMVFVGVVSVSVLIQTIALVGMALGASKTQKQFLNIAEELRSKATPVLDLSRGILEDSAPKLRVMTDNVAEASFLLRDQAQRLDATVRNTLDTVNVQVERADQMVSATLDGIGEITSSVQKSVMVPVKQIAGIVNGLKAAVDKLTGSKIGRAVYGRNEDDFV